MIAIDYIVTLHTNSSMVCLTEFRLNTPYVFWTETDLPTFPQ